MKISNEEKERIIGSYTPCIALVKDEKVHLFGINYEEGEVAYSALSQVGAVDPDAIHETCCWLDKVSVVLSPLSAMSDEHAIEVAKICQAKTSERDMLIYLGGGIVLFHLCDISPWGDISNTRFPHLDKSGTRNFISDCRPCSASGRP